MRSPLTRVALIAGMGLGLALGLAYSWLVDPVELTDTHPGLLRSDHRYDWVHLTAFSYAADGDLERALTRLRPLEREEVDRALKPLIEQYAAAGPDAETLRRLTTLGKVLDVDTPAVLVYADAVVAEPAVADATPPPPAWLSPVASVTVPPAATATLPPTSTAEPTATPLPTSTPLPTATPLPTVTPEPVLTPSPTPTAVTGASLVAQEQLCESGEPLRIEVVVQDDRGQGVPGVEVWLIWSDGADRAVTGLKPAHGAGYADFNAVPDVTYALSVDGLRIPAVTGLRLEDCPGEEAEESFLGSWRIVVGP